MTEPELDPAAGTTEVDLPGGPRVRCVSVPEATVLWTEATEAGLYRSAAETLRSGDTVLDIGANIGLVSLMFGRTVPGLRIVAVEPAPVTFACLAANVRRHLPGAACLRAAVCDEPGERTFTYYPRSTGNSGLFADARADDRTTRTFLRNSGIPEEFIGDMVRGLHVGVELTVPALTVSDLIRRYGLGRVDVLKVDVERAERLVLDGVEDRHWPLIRRVVAEVHDDDGRLGGMVELLRGRGFTTRVSQHPKLAGTELFELEAGR